MLSRVLKTPQSLPRISPFLGPVVSGPSEPADKFFSPSLRTRTKPLRPWTARRRYVHGSAGENENGIVSTGYYTCKTAAQQQRELRAKPKPLNSSSNQRPTPASDIMPSAGAKLQLGPPLLQHMSVRNLSSQPQATRATKTTLGNNATAQAETNNGNGVRAAGIDAGASRDEQSTKITSSQSKSQSPAVRTTATTTTNQPPRGTAYLARQSVITHTQEPQPIPVHTHILTSESHRLVLHREIHDPDLFPSPPRTRPASHTGSYGPLCFCACLQKQIPYNPRGAVDFALLSA
ncbi:hypothetical protein CSIM01_08388 [Colletotrichum simmondsii]|uniref:Uncharacterized protein n=1 Tax=Colletotrichum simmondsii TaxID=703756 RepID=A0A135SYF1_9PEZI|nr:hypothetical protein CSIM01_08388 [Colletotrichum simmondsii]